MNDTSDLEKNVNHAQYAMNRYDSGSSSEVAYSVGYSVNVNDFYK